MSTGSGARSPVLRDNHPVDYRWVVSGMVLFCLIGLPPGAALAQTPEHRCNVLLIAVDDMKDWLGCMRGYEGVVKTPNMDRLADRGMLFTNAHCTSPKCAPSRAALLLGRRPSSTGLYDNGHWWLPNVPDAVSLPLLFKRHGYQVVGAGKVFHHTAGNQPPNQWHEFQRITFQEDPWFRGVRANYPWSNPQPFPEGFPFSGIQGLGHENDWGVLTIRDEDYDDARTEKFVLQFLESLKRQRDESAESTDGRTAPKPFFLACGFFRPHLPWYVPQRYFDQYPIEDIVIPAVDERDLDDVPAAGKRFAMNRRQDFELIRDSRKWGEAIRAYLASISCVDDRIGRVLDTLEASGEAERTIVVLWSDHGWHLGEKGHWHKSTLWEEATRVPLIIASQQGTTGVCRRPVGLIDLFPTLIEMTNLPQVDDLDGQSLRPLLLDPMQKWERPAITEYLRGNAAVRSERYRYIRYADGGEELYDHRSDPKEWHNLANSDVHAKLKAELNAWMPQSWAPPAETKKAFEFDPETFTWVHRASGKVFRGK